MKHNENGRAAESVVAQFLAKHGYDIVDRNWRTKQCEIDIVAQKDERMYFVEVKYRSDSSRGSGFEYITASKLRQMEFASRCWVAAHKWEGEYVLSGAAVAGTSYAVTFLEEL